ncbi:MAG TPA: hypothetical protein VNO33_15665 [Kofleriaceae bacterium]|nr:hypothetical protein [Kofleriaceae bacterium]
MAPGTNRKAALATSAAASVAAALVAGLTESLVSGIGWWAGVLATGAAAAIAVPVGLLVAPLARGLWRRADPGAAGLWAGAGAVLFVTLAGWIAATASASLTHVPRLAALTVGLCAIAAGAIAALVSVPATRGLAALEQGRPSARTAALLGCALSLLLWPVAPYLAALGISSIAAHSLAARLHRAPERRLVLGIGLVAAVALAALTLHAASDRQALLDARRAPVGGLVIRAAGL